MADDIDMTGWPYTGEKYESDYGFGSCNCSNCMREYKMQGRSLRPHYNTVQRPVRQMKTIDERQNEMAVAHDKIFGMGSWPNYIRNELSYTRNEPLDAQPVEKPIQVAITDNMNLVLFFFIILIVVVLWQRICIEGLNTRLKLIGKSKV